MGRPPLYEKPMTATERKRRSRQLDTSVHIRVNRLRRAFNAAGEDAQVLFIKWLRSMKLIK
jgi:hypothetical protein